MEKKEQIAQMSRIELEQEFRKKFTAEANLEDSKREWWADETYYWTKYIVYDGFVRDNDCILLTPKPIIMDIKGELPSHLTKRYRNNQIKE
ncbi:hypothetical protein VN1161_14660 [Helicobacter pylori]|nr:hypothetical protein VN1161_14660 [Helicobacter pylori]